MVKLDMVVKDIVLNQFYWLILTGINKYGLCSSR